MLKALRELFESAPEGHSDDDPKRLHLAAAVLLFEVARSDHATEPAELRRLERFLGDQWRLDDAALAELMEVAEREAELSASLHQQVEIVNRRFSAQQKYALLLGFWQVANADGRIHHYEEHLVRRLADLLYIPHADFIRAKHEVIESG